MLTVSADGIHPTTEACIELLQWLHENHDFANILEIGCGSGVLSLLAASIWQADVLAVDISENAVHDTARLIDENDRQAQVTAIRSDGFGAPEIAARAPYDLIVCNLVAATLITISSDIRKHLVPGGFCVISGALSWLAQDVETALAGQGFEIIKKISRLSWNSYIIRGLS